MERGKHQGYARELIKKPERSQMVVEDALIPEKRMGL